MPSLLYVVGTYPSLTTTFIDREIEHLRRMDVPVDVVALRRPGHEVSPEQRALQEHVRYLLPVRVAQVLASHAHFLRTRAGAYVRVLSYLLTRPHPSFRARVRTLLHFGMAVQVARMGQQGPAVDHVHAHFVDRATIVALVVSRLLDVPYSATAHANDIYVDPVLLPEKLAEARFVATCTRYNAEYLSSIAGAAGSRVICVHHGLDAASYHPHHDGESARPLLLAVAQLRQKKGLSVLIDACAVLRDLDYEFACEIVGEGPLRPELEAQIRTHSLGDVVRLTGALEHAAVVERYRRAAVFVLPCVTAPDGDRDGIPNAILEAMAMEIPVVSTRHSGIPEAIEHDVSGLLVAPDDAPALAEAIAGLLDDPVARGRLGRRARAVVLDAFDLDANVRRLLSHFSAMEVVDG